MIQFINQFKVALSTGATNTDTSLSLTDASHLTFGKIGDYYLLTLIQSGTNNLEIVRVTAKVGNDITVIRGQEGTSALAFVAGDPVENRLTAGACMSFSEPVGTIKAWIPASFSDANNGGFTLELGIATNDVEGANAYLASTAYRVADGSIPNLALSPIWNDNVKCLPNLKDERFIQGSSGGAGGSNTMGDHKHGKGTINITTGGIHSHGPAAGNMFVYNNSGIPNAASGPGVAAGHYVNGRTAAENHTHVNSEFSGEVGSGAADPAANSTENRPKFLNCFYIIKVF